MQVERILVSGLDLFDEGVDDSILERARAQLVAQHPAEPECLPVMVDVCPSIFGVTGVELAGVYECSENVEEVGIVFREMDDGLFALLPALSETGEEEVGVVS